MSDDQVLSYLPRDQAALLRSVAERECAQVLTLIRESYRPSGPIEAIVIAAFAHGAGWAFNQDAKAAQQ